jgi:hypothetical protein
MASFGLLTNPSNEIISEIAKIYELNFDYAEIGIEGPEGNPDMINKKKDEIVKLLQRFKQKPIGHTPYWIDLGMIISDKPGSWRQKGKLELQENWA